MSDPPNKFRDTELFNQKLKPVTDHSVGTNCFSACDIHKHRANRITYGAVTQLPKCVTLVMDRKYLVRLLLSARMHIYATVLLTKALYTESCNLHSTKLRKFISYVNSSMQPKKNVWGYKISYRCQGF